MASYWKIPGLFIVSRFFLIFTFTPGGLRGYGDFVHFYRLAGMGWPFLDYWSEFPPLFPFISTILFRLTNGQEHIFDYALVILLTLVQAASIALFIRLTNQMFETTDGQTRTWLFLAILLVLPYGWWYFDSLTVLLMLISIALLIDHKDIITGMTVGIGVLVKLFPIFVLPAVWRYRPRNRAFLSTIIAVGLVVSVYLGLYIASPDMTTASLLSQFRKGSWETVWALIDGNLNTGNFGPEIERYDPSAAFLLRGNPSRLPSWITLIPFSCLGLYLFWRARLVNPRSVIAFVGVTWCIFLLWSPGWSPQWVLYLIPLILLTLPFGIGSLFTISLILINLLEWPVLLSRGFDQGLWMTVPVRAIILIMLAVEFWRVVRYPGIISSIKNDKY